MSQLNEVLRICHQCGKQAGTEDELEEFVKSKKRPQFCEYSDKEEK